MPDNVPYWKLDPFYGEGGDIGTCPPGQVWNERWNECQIAEDTYPDPSDPYTPPDIPTTPPDIPTEPGAAMNEFNCTPGTMYTDASGGMRYCPSTQSDTGYAAGIGTETAWAEQSNPLLDILSQNPEFLQNFDISKIMSMFPDLGTEKFDLAQKGYQETLGELRQEKGMQRRTMADVLRGGAMESGAQLSSSGFAGGGAYGMQAGKERKRSLRDYRQAIEGINLGMTEADIGFERAVGDIRYDYGEQVSDVMASLYGLDPTLELTAGEQCPDGQIFWEGACTPIEQTDFANYDIDWG
jgi:hypothetical protein